MVGKKGFLSKKFNTLVVAALTLMLAGAADMIHQADLSGPLLAEKINNYLRDRAKLEVMAEKARMLGHPNAAEVIVEDMYKLVGKVGSMKA